MSANWRSSVVIDVLSPVGASSGVINVMRVFLPHLFVGIGLTEHDKSDQQEISCGRFTHAVQQGLHYRDVFNDFIKDARAICVRSVYES